MSNNMQNLKIYDIIDQLEDLIENSPKPLRQRNQAHRGR